MPNAPRDQNHVPTKLGVLFSDGTTLVPIAVNPTNGGIKVNTVDTILVPVTQIALRDENFVHVMMGISSVDETPIPWYVDSTGAVLVAT